MYYHPATQANLRLLEQRGATILPPEEGHLASGAVGMGRFPETATILAAIRRLLARGGDLAGGRSSSPLVARVSRLIQCASSAIVLAG